jgi:hypothetical protein
VRGERKGKGYGVTGNLSAMSLGRRAHRNLGARADREDRNSQPPHVVRRCSLAAPTGALGGWSDTDTDGGLGGEADTPANQWSR